MIFEDPCSDPHKPNVGRPQPANWPPSFSWKSDRLAYVRDKTLVLLQLDGAGWKERSVIPLPFEPGIVYPCPRTISWSSDDSELMLVEAREGAYRVVWDRGLVSKIKCPPGEVYSGMFLGRGSSVVSISVSERFETVLLSNGVVVATWRDVAIVAQSGDRGTWLVRRQADGPPTRGFHVDVWDALTRKARTRLAADVNLAAFSVDGRLLATSERHLVVIHDGQSGAILCTIDHYAGDRVVALAISPDGRHLLTMGRPTDRTDDGVVLWELTFTQSLK